MTSFWSTLPSFVGDQWPLVDFTESYTRHDSRNGTSSPIEEENLEGYQPDDFYPIYIGQVLVSAKSRYQIVTKSAYDELSPLSTTWLARDLLYRRYVSLKLFVRDPVAGSAPERERAMYQKLKDGPANHLGRRYVAQLFDSFVIEGLEDGDHQVLVHTPWFPEKSCNLKVRDCRDSSNMYYRDKRAHMEEYVKLCGFDRKDQAGPSVKTDDPLACATIENLERLTPSARNEGENRLIFKSREIKALGTVGQADPCFVPRYKIPDAVDESVSATVTN